MQSPVHIVKYILAGKNFSISITKLPSHDKRYSKGNSSKPHCDDVRRAATK